LTGLPGDVDLSLDALDRMLVLGTGIGDALTGRVGTRTLPPAAVCYDTPCTGHLSPKGMR